MIIVNQAVSFKWILRKTSNVYVAADFDLTIKNPDKTAAYDDNMSGTGFVAPTATTDGEITKTITFTTAGLHELILSTGSSDSYTEYSKNLVYVNDITTSQEIVVNGL